MAAPALTVRTFAKTDLERLVKLEDATWGEWSYADFEEWWRLANGRIWLAIDAAKRIRAFWCFWVHAAHIEVVNAGGCPDGLRRLRLEASAYFPGREIIPGKMLGRYVA